MSSGVADFQNRESPALAFYTQRDFEQRVGATFSLRTDDAVVVEAVLSALDDQLPATRNRINGREHFWLLFRAVAEQPVLKQQTCTVSNREMGTFRLFLVPASVETLIWVTEDDLRYQLRRLGQNEDGTRDYLAVLNRVSYSVMGSGPARAIDWPRKASRFNDLASLYNN